MLLGHRTIADRWICCRPGDEHHSGGYFSSGQLVFFCAKNHRISCCQRHLPTLDVRQTRGLYDPVILRLYPLHSMTLSIPIPLILGYLLLLFRSAGLFLFLPLPGLTNAPDFLRISLAFALVPALWNQLGQRQWNETLLADFLLLAIGETLWGVVLGLLVKVLEEFTLLGAQQLGFQAGFSYASTIDPSSNADSTVFQTLLSLFSMFLFFSLGVHRLIIAGFARAGNPLLDNWTTARGEVLESLSRAITSSFQNGLAFAIPVVAAMASLDVLAGLLGRMLPQIQTALFTMPAKMLLSFVGLAIVLPIAVTRYRISAETSLGLWNQLLHLPGKL